MRKKSVFGRGGCGNLIGYQVILIEIFMVMILMIDTKIDNT